MAFPFVPLLLIGGAALVLSSAAKPAARPEPGKPSSGSPSPTGTSPIIPASAFYFDNGIQYFVADYAEMGMYKLLRYYVERVEVLERKPDGSPLIERMTAKIGITTPILALPQADGTTKIGTGDLPKDASSSALGWVLGRNSQGKRILAQASLAQIATPTTTLPSGNESTFVEFYNTQGNFPERISIIAIDGAIPVASRPYALASGGQGYAVLVNDPGKFKSDSMPVSVIFG